MISWWTAKEKTGQATLYNSNITLNKVASVPFEFANRVQVGLDENQNIVIEPISKDRVERGDLDEYNLLEIKTKPSYSRICSTDLMNFISKSLKLALSTEPIRFETVWEEENNHLIVLVNKKGKESV